MQPLKILIVEDEVLIGETIKIYLNERGHLPTDIVISYEEALQSLSLSLPDVVLVDIRLFGDKSGIDLADEIQNKYANLPVVFLTSQYDTRVTNKALELNPAGYLVKPIQKESLWTTVELAYNKILSQNTAPAIKFADGTKVFYLSANQIKYISSDHIYIVLHTTNSGEITLRMSLSEVEGLLEKANFIRCHRSYLVNKSYITQYDTHSFFIDQINIPISRSHKSEVKKLMLQID
ncbi:MAG: response regulator transcription factor [Saprospiraceae bacterium]|nr:response regulator transcription factor [Saprospiraceae bacterium]